MNRIAIWFFLSLMVFQINRSATAQSFESVQCKSKFSIGFEAGLFANNAVLKDNNSLPEDVTQSITGVWNFSGNIITAYYIDDRFKIKFSPGIENKQLEYRLDGLHFYQDFNGTGFNDSHVIYTEEAIAISLPLEAEYKFTTGKFSPFLSAGCATDFLMNKKYHASIYYSNGTEEIVSEAELFRNVDFALVAQGGFYFQATDNINLHANAFVKYFLLHQEIDMKQYHAGLRIGISYIIKKCV
ncbi:MAG: hypothetical protein WBB36_10275 [Chitinophagales bacterium]